ncbi:putative Cholesterol 7-alpha-monooxygenase [Glarea lozoyensis 74030]|nr:putative Cholesterol 7-alpha-monooxygenase [Glarea lozoyensis 74030]
MNALTERLFVNEANATAAVEACDIPGNAASLVTFSSKPENLARWERSANVKLIDSQTVEADMLHLVRDFGACMSIPQLYGRHFLEREQTVLDDLWIFDNDLFPLMMVGIPQWVPFKMIKDGVAARSRLHKSLEGVYRRADQYLKGEPVDDDTDMSDISSVIRGRVKLYDENGLTMDYRGQLELGNLWGQNANTQPMVFWFLLFIYSTPGLVEQLRKEISSHVTVTDSKITSFDLQGITRCALLKGSVYETFRMVDEPTSIRYVRKPITLSDGQYTHNLKEGTWISAAHAIANKDAANYPEPHKFVPDRFLEIDENGARTARYGKLRPWGGGAGICKGRTFAEKEIIAIGAAVISLWDISPVGKEWVIPPMRPGTGTMQPVSDVRVRISRREVH